MDDESLEDRSLEVLEIPVDVGDELLCLYFENKRRSGGGTLSSVDREGSKALLVFDDVEDAARVLSKRPHTLHNATLTVRKKAPKDPGKLLLRGLNPKTSLELVELYVENITGIDSDNYTLYPSPGRDLAMIHFYQPYSDFQSLCAKIAKKPLDGARILLEQIECTDSILVENLRRTVTEDTLTLYFESSRGGGGEVKDVSIIAEGIARVSFKDFESVECILRKSHKLDETNLKVKPYFSFLQAEESPASTSTQNGMSDGVAREAQHPQTMTSSLQALPPAIPEPLNTATTPKHQNANITTTPEPLTTSTSGAEAGVAEEAMEVLPSNPEPSSSHIPVPEPVRCNPEPSSSHILVSDPVKLHLFEMSALPQDLQKAHPGFYLHVVRDGVRITGPNQLCVERLKNAILESLGGMTQAHLTFDMDKTQFLAREEVKGRLLLALKDRGLLSAYVVSDCVVVVTSLSASMVGQACALIESLVCKFSVPVDMEYECMLYSHECDAFLHTLEFCSAKVSGEGSKITVVTLKGMEEEKQAQIIRFLSTPIQKEIVITMKPGMLKYIQNHCHQLLADMDQVTIFPLEAGDGLSISGNVGACQMAEEVLLDVVSTGVCTRTITVHQPGVARFLVQDEGSSILAEMQAKFQVYISMEKVHWEPLENEDFFEYAWKMTSHQNFLRNSLDGPAQPLTSTQPNANSLNAADRAHLEEAKRILSVIDVESSEGPCSLRATNTEEEDLYTAAGTDSSDQGTDSSAMLVEDTSQATPEGDDGTALPMAQDAELGLATQLSLEAMNTSSLDEDAIMSLAIQMSMETNQRSTSVAEDEDSFQKALEMSMCGTILGEDSQLQRAVEVSLQDAIKSANTAEIFVYAGYTHDLIRVDIALGKKVGLRQCEEKVEHKSMRSLSAHQRRCVEVIKRKHAVEIQIQGTTATISGFKDYVAEAIPDMKNLLKRVSNTMSDAEILKTVQWVWHEQGAAAAATPYPPDATVFIENAWKMRQKKTDILFNNQLYSIDFVKMQEHSLATGRSVPIARKMLSSEDLYTDLPEEDYSLLSNLPEVSRVDEASDEFQDVVKEFYDSIQEYHNKIKIVKVEKLMNRLLYNQYKLKKANMQQSATEPEVERTLYHGTSETSVKEICIQGFNRSFCGKNATVYGQGVYFAVNSSLSVSDTYSPPNADGHKFVFAAKVLTGDFTIGKHEMKTAPLKENSDIPVRYHSVADKTGVPTLFVIFNDTQAYPEYLITCQKIYGR